MITGRFFIFDTEVSTSTYSVFRYNRLQKAKIHGAPLREQHPVYVALDAKQLGFYIDSYEEKKLNHELFSFPLLNDASSDKEITRQLEDMGEPYYKISGNKVLIHKYTEGVGFCNLWFTDEQKRENSERNHEEKLYKDALLLDFLFDFVHTDVFKSNPDWQLLNARIQTNTLLQAILAKGEWLYWRNKYKKSSVKNEGSHAHISNELFDADERWIEIIAAESSAQLFLRYNDWFSPVNAEMKRVLYGDTEKKTLSDYITNCIKSGVSRVVGKKSIKTDNPILKLKTYKQFVKFIFYVVGLLVLIYGFNLLNWLSLTFNYSFFKDKTSDSFIAQLLLLLVLIIVLRLLRGSIYREEDKKLTLKDRQIWLIAHFDRDRTDYGNFDKMSILRDRIYHFFFARFDFDDGYKWFMRLLPNGFRYLLNYTILFFIANLLMSVQVLQIDENLKPNNWPVFLNIYSDFFDVYINWKRISILLMVMVLFIVIIMPMLFVVFMQAFPDKNHFPSIFHPGLTLPKTSLAMLTGWLVWVPISEEAWKLNANVEELRIFAWLFLMLLLAIVFIFFTLKGIQPELVVGKGLTGSTIGVVLSGYAFAFGWGVLTTQFTCRQALDEPDLLMPYVFGETEKIKGFNKEKGDILEIAAKFNDATNSQFDTVTNFSKIKVMWTDSTKDFTKKYFDVQDSNKIMDVIHLTQEGKIDSEKLIKLLKTQQEKIIHNLIKKHTDKEKQLPAVLSWKIWFPYDYYIYIFPRMLLINSGIAFFLGFFAQIAFQSAGYKEPI